MKRYCVDCGSLMIKQLKPLNCFDEFTGKREVQIVLKCPNSSFWKLRHLITILSGVGELDD